MYSFEAVFESTIYMHALLTWLRHQMETFSALLVFCVGNSSVTSEFPAHRLVTRSFDVFFDLHLNQQLSKQWRRWWFERHRAHYDIIVMKQWWMVYIFMVTSSVAKHKSDLFNYVTSRMIFPFGF